MAELKSHLRQIPTRRQWAGLTSGGPSYLMRDEFTDTRAAGAVNGTLATPGGAGTAAMNTRTVVDIDGDALSIGSGVMTFANPNSAWGNPGLWHGAQTRAAGLALLASAAPVASKYMGVGWFPVQSGELNLSCIGFLLSGATNSFRPRPQDAIIDAFAATAYKFAVVLRSTGAFYAISGGAFTSWTLIWIGNTLNTATLYPGITNYDSTASTDWLRVAQLPAPFTTDYGIATTRLAGARTAGDTGSHEASALLEFTVATRPAAGQADFRFRRQDATNYWSVTVDSSGNLDLDEVVAGIATQRGTSAGVIANGDRIVIIASGSTIKVFEAGTLRITYTSATNFATATVFLLADEGTGGAVTDIVTWPRTLSGQALATLNAYTA